MSFMDVSIFLKLHNGADVYDILNFSTRRSIIGSAAASYDETRCSGAEKTFPRLT